MTTIHKTVDIPQNRRLNLELQLPEELPIGKAEIMMMISPVPEPNHLIITPARKVSHEGERFQGLAGSLSHSKAFDGDPVDLVRAVRDEW